MLQPSESWLSEVLSQPRRRLRSLRVVVVSVVAASLLFMPWHFPPTLADTGEQNIAEVMAVHGSHEVAPYPLAMHEASEAGIKYRDTEAEGAPAHAFPCHNVTIQCPALTVGGISTPPPPPRARIAPSQLAIPVGQGPEPSCGPPRSFA